MWSNKCPAAGGVGGKLFDGIEKSSGFDGSGRRARRMGWSRGMPLRLFEGVRTFTLTPGIDGSTDFRVREGYTGPLLGLMWRSMPYLGPSFPKFAPGLKA